MWSNALQSCKRTTKRLLPRSFTSIRKIRNIGIVAHIDAGKTTTGERMLYYAGEIRRMGEVHDGDTVMDFTAQERDRGITIGSAAITFDWKNTKINLIDTPGHVDFTIEVERSIRVLDGAVAIFDAVAGVQAQTETIWEQTERYKVPRIAFVNKLDRIGASLDRTCSMIQDRFHVQPLIIQMPVGIEDEFDDIVDLVEMEMVQWKDDSGEEYVRLPLVPAGQMKDVHERAVKKRVELIEKLANVDSTIEDLYLEEAPVSALQLKDALRRATASRKAVVVLCGSSLKNRGVQLLLDGIADYLPSPLDKPDSLAKQKDGTTFPVVANADNPLCALVFKIQYDPMRGPVAFFRVYAGRMKNKSLVLNASNGKKERITRLLQVAANDVQEVDEIEAGNIGAAIGLKSTKTGDTINFGKESNPVQLPGLRTPEAVFTCSIEPDTSANAKKLTEVLDYMQLEDPSFKVTQDEETGQTLMHGMGELHLEVIIDRLGTEYQLNPSVGKMRVAYRETITEPSACTYTYDKLTSTTRQFATIRLRVEPYTPVNGELYKIQWHKHPEAKFPTTYAEAIQESLEFALRSGPVRGYLLTNVIIHIDEESCAYDNDSSTASFQACTSIALRKALLSANPILLEPMVHLQATVPDDYIGGTLSDLNANRRAQIQQVSSLSCSSRNTNTKSIVSAIVPLEKMIGYASAIRSLTKGEGSFSITFDKYAPYHEY